MQPTGIITIIRVSILIACLVFFLRPRFLIVFILLFIYLLPRAGFMLSTEWYRVPLPIGYLFIAFIMVRWLFQSIFGRDKMRRTIPGRKTFILYCLIAISAIITGLIRNGYIPTMALDIVFYFLAFFVFFMVIGIFERRDCAKIFMDGILICAFLVSLYGILLLIYGKPFLIEYVTYNSYDYYKPLGPFIKAKRTLSSYGDPNTLSAQLIVFCGIFTSLFLNGKGRILRKTFLLVGIISTVMCIYFTGSRASLLGLFLLLLILAATKIKRLWLYIPVLVTGYIIFIEPLRRFYEHRLFIRGLPSDVNISYIKTFSDILIHIPFGVGFGNTVDEFYNVRPAAGAWDSFNSFYLHLFSRVGIQGLVIFVVLLFFILRFLFKASSQIEDVNTKYFIFGGACGLIAQQFNFMTNNVYHVPGGMFNFWIMYGMLTTIINLYAKPLAKSI